MDHITRQDNVSRPFDQILKDVTKGVRVEVDRNPRLKMQKPMVTSHLPTELYLNPAVAALAEGVAAAALADRVAPAEALKAAWELEDKTATAHPSAAKAAAMGRLRQGRPKGNAKAAQRLANSSHN